MVVVPGRTWSLLLVGAALARATSYEFRPPRSGQLSEILTGEIPYPWWSVVLVTGSVFVIAGCLRSRTLFGHWLAFIGHAILFLSYCTYTLSLMWATALGEPWAGIFPIGLIALLNARRVITIGSDLGRL